MPLTERSRSALYQGLIVVIDDEQAVQEMLSSFPGREGDEPATKDFVRAELALTRGDFRSEMAAMGSDLRGEMAALRVEVHELLRRQRVWTIATLLACMTIQTAVLALVAR